MNAATSNPSQSSPPSTELAVVSREAAFDSYRRGLEPNGMQQTERFAANIFKTGYCKAESPEDVFARIVFGRELGLTAMVSVRAIYVVNGRPGIDASVMHALCLQFKECEYFECVETTAKIATYRAKRRGRPEMLLSWTIEQGTAAGVFGGRDDGKGGKTKPKDNWVNYPDNMLRARCISNLARIMFPEPISGLHTPDELDHMPPQVVQMTAQTTQATDGRAVIDAIDESEKIAQTWKDKISAASTKEDKKAIRDELKKLKDSGALAEPYYAEVAAFYNAKFPVATKPAAAQPPAAAATAPTEPAPPEPAKSSPQADGADDAGAEAALGAKAGREPGEEG